MDVLRTLPKGSESCTGEAAEVPRSCQGTGSTIGRSCTGDADPLDPTCSGEVVDVTVSDNENGRYTIEYQPTRADEYTIRGFLGTMSIPAITLTDPADPASVRTITVGYAATAACLPTPEDLPDATCGLPNSFTVQSKDQYGNNRLEDSDRIWIVRKDPDQYDVELTYDNTGAPNTYWATYEGAGVYRVTWSVTQIPNSINRWLEVYAGDATEADFSTLDQVHGSPFSMSVLPGGISPDSITLDVSSQGLTSAQAGQDAIFGIEAFDEFNNLLSGTVPGLEVGLNGRNGEGSLVGVVEEDPDNPAALRARYMAQKVGVYNLIVTVAGVQITQELADVVVSAGEIFPLGCRASGAGLTNGKMGEVSEFTITAKDSFENFVTASIRAKEYACISENTCPADGVIGREQTPSRSLIEEPVGGSARRSNDSRIVFTMWGCGSISEGSVKSSSCPDGRENVLDTTAAPGSALPCTLWIQMHLPHVLERIFPSKEARRLCKRILRVYARRMDTSGLQTCATTKSQLRRWTVRLAC